MVRVPHGYYQEARILRRIIARYAVHGAKSLLDAGCGTGGHLRYLVRDFDCTGLDLHEGMLRVARKTVPEARFLRADMTDFQLGERFDVIICMFSAIGLVRTYSNLRKTIRSFSSHLRSGGIVILENESFTYRRSPSPYLNLVTAETPDTKIARVEYYRQRGNVLIEREEYLVAQKGKGIRHFADLQYLGMFEPKKTMRIMLGAGLQPRFLKGALHSGNGVLIGIKSP
jgi:SAM-dependent methyltransferase